MLQKYEAAFKKGAYVFFILFLVVGCFSFSEYGVSIDEGVSRVRNGELNYNFVKTGVPGALLETREKYHGPVYELFLYTSEKILGLTDYRDIYLLRHLLTFLTFFVATLFFYLLCLKIFKSHFASLLGCIMLVISPRIFAESFYNSKDIPMLCFCIIASYSMFLFLEKQTIKTSLLHAVCCALVIDIRLTGLLLPFITIYMYLMQTKRNVLPISVFLGSLVIFIFAFWPILWLGPITHFVNAFKQMSNYPSGTLLYMGNIISTHDLPWHYLPVWILVTTPICYSLFFFIGMYFLVKNSLINFKSTLAIQSFLFVLAAPILAVIVLHSTVYDGWRHVYFTYPYFILIGVYGATQLIKTLKNNIEIFAVLYLTAFSVILVLAFMIKNNPYGNMYFNSLAGNNIRQNFELDYWGLSYRKGLEYILEHDKSEQIYVEADPVFPFVQMNSLILPLKERNRIVFTDRNSAQYFLTNFRWHPQDYNFGTSIFKINVDDQKIMEVIKLK